MGAPRIDPLWSYFREWSLMPAAAHPNAWQEPTAVTTPVRKLPWGFPTFITTTDKPPVHARLSAVHPYTSDAYLREVGDRLRSLQTLADKVRDKYPRLARLVAGDIDPLSGLFRLDIPDVARGASIFAHVEPRRVLASSLFEAQAAANGSSGINANQVARAFVSPAIRRAFGIATSAAVLALVVGGLGLLQLPPFVEDGKIAT